MRTIARVFCWLGAALGLSLAILLGAFGVLQTRVGQAWLAETVAQTVNSPDFAVSVTPAFCRFTRSRTGIR